jgi:hypothetical protein
MHFFWARYRERIVRSDRAMQVVRCGSSISRHLSLGGSQKSQYSCRLENAGSPAKRNDNVMAEPQT